MFCIYGGARFSPHTKKPKSMGDTPPLTYPAIYMITSTSVPGYSTRYRVVPACGGWAAACFYYKKCFCVMRRGLGHLPRPGSLAAGRRLVLAARRGLRRAPAPQWEGAAGTAAVSTTTASLMPCAARRAPRRSRSAAGYCPPDHFSFPVPASFSRDCKCPGAMRSAGRPPRSGCVAQHVVLRDRHVDRGRV